MGTRVAGTVAAQLAGNAPLSTDTSTAASSTKKNTPAKGKGKKASPAKKADASSGDPSGFPDNFVLGLILFSYPLHTADNTKALRDQILYDIPVSIPTLFVSGLKDTMCRPVLFEKVFKDMKASPREVVQVLEADHGLGFGSSKAGVSKKGALIDAIAEWASAFVDETIESVDKDKKGKGKGKAATAVMKKKAELKKTGEEWTVVVSTTA
ncbi:Testis-expressed protein 30 [Gamsiella multidivaricata]|nr:Testis-expressed protein 30 [Gamsiella multidivaricata]